VPQNHGFITLNPVREDVPAACEKEAGSETTKPALSS
jgi:hypothetical protein